MNDRTASRLLSPGAEDLQAGRRATVMVVDDTPDNLTLMAQVLRPHWRVVVAVSGSKALELAQRNPPDLVLLDVMMPGLDGFETCRRLKSEPRTRDVPVIFLTALSRPEDESAAFAAGGADFVVKPFHAETLLARVRTQLSLKSAQDRLRDRNLQLTGELGRRQREVSALRDATLTMMVGMAEFRDLDTGHHIVRTQEYVRTLAEWLAMPTGEPAALQPDQIDPLARAALLHDIGKVAVPDAILLKPGRLDEHEWAVMQTHTVVGAELLQRAIDRLGEDAGPLLRYGVEIARHHHERWDGAGYPDGLAGEAIPLSARLMAVADVYDALISRRPYKKSLSHDEALALILSERGSHFDPLVVQALAACEDLVVAIADHWRD